MRLPSQFVNRLGELAGAELEMDTIKNLNFGAQAFAEAKQYDWGIAEGTIPEHMIPIMNQRVKQGIQMKMLISKERLPAVGSISEMPKNMEYSGLSELPAIVTLTEKVAGICFMQLGGRIDYAGFFGTDPAFHNWVKDLFLYYWEKAKRV
jgi:predicted transcriptional regulator